MKTFSHITRHRFLFFFISILFSLPFLFNLPHVKTVDNVDYFTLENDPDIRFYSEFKEVFGNDEFFIIAFRRDDIFSQENLSLLKEITDDLEEIPEIREVRSLANVNDTVGEDDYFIVRKFIENIPTRQEALTKLKKNALANPLYVKNLISSDGKTAAILVSVFNHPDEPGYRKRLIEKCESTIGRYKDRTGRVFMAGWTTTNLYLSQYMKRDIVTFIPVTYLLITLAVFFFFRNIWLTLIAVLNISICMGTTMGLFPMLGITLNNVTTIVPPLVMALALCDTVHIFSHLNADLLKRFASKELALSYVLKKVFVPCFLTSLTTAIGFLSLALSDIAPIREFALIASAGMVFEFIFAFMFMPGLLLIFSSDKIFRIPNHSKNRESSFLKGIVRITRKHNRIIIFSAIGLILASGFLASRIKVETNLLDYFRKESPVKIAANFVESNLAGIRTLDISLTAKQTDAFKNPANLELLEKIETYALSVTGVDSALSFADFIKDMNQSFHNERSRYYKIPDSEEKISQYLLLYDFDDIDEFVNETFDHARISLRTSAHKTSEQKQIISQMKDFLGNLERTDLELRVTGRAVLHVNTIDALVKGQVQSLAIAASVIAFILFITLKSLPLSSLSLVPNLFPILINFGIMGALAIPLNTATALIAAVAIGIAVDDTIHFLSEYKNRRKLGFDISQATEHAINEKGRAIILSSLILCIGFGAMITSRFIPTANFGALSAVIMITAVIGDLIILPALLFFYHENCT